MLSLFNSAKLDRSTGQLIPHCLNNELEKSRRSAAREILIRHCVGGKERGRIYGLLLQDEKSGEERRQENNSPHRLSCAKGVCRVNVSIEYMEFHEGWRRHYYCCHRFPHNRWVFYVGTYAGGLQKSNFETVMEEHSFPEKSLATLLSHAIETGQDMLYCN